MPIFRIIDRYVLMEVLKPLGTALGIGLMVLLSERMVRILDITLGKKNSFSVVFEMLGYLVPHYLGIAMPAALFLGLLFGFNKLSKNSEIDAMLASGISLHRIARPVIAFSFLLTMITTIIFGWLQPHTRYAYRALVHTVKNVEVFYLAEEGVFMQAGTRTFILDKMERGTNRFQRIFLFDYQGKGGAETITAKRGYLAPQNTDPRPLLVMQDGNRMALKKWPDFENDKTPPKHTFGVFSRATLPIGKGTAARFRPRGQNERELTFPELLYHYNSPPEGVSLRRLRVELHKRVVSVLTVIILPFLALPFALGHRRQQRAYRFAVGLIILIAYYEIIQQAAAVAKSGALPMWVALWLPFGLLAAFAAWRYWRTCFTLSSDGFERVYDAMSRLAAAVRKLLARRGPSGTEAAS